MKTEDKMRLIELMTERIMTVGRVKDKILAEEIARRWVGT